VAARWFHANFGEVEDVLAEAGVEKVDGLLADLGVSTNQLLEGKHGLSFSGDEALDMRLDPRIKRTAADLLRELDEKQIADLIYQYADERFSFRIARKIVQTRAVEPIRNTGQLARIVRSVVPTKAGQIDPATRTFQALRIAVNQEFESLEDLLAVLPEIMKPGGRAAFISFHSGEDRLVKLASRQWAADGKCELLTKKPVEADEAESNRNPRSRSAKLRAVKFV
jgi:16S rRNA (cytosine1402-N4)-methyltransferase